MTAPTGPELALVLDALRAALATADQPSILWHSLIDERARLAVAIEVVDRWRLAARGELADAAQRARFLLADVRGFLARGLASPDLLRAAEQCDEAAERALREFDAPFPSPAK